MNTGKFIVVEGFDGVGKSTFVKALQQALEMHGIMAITTRQPGGTPVAERLREILKDPNVGEGISPVAEYLMMSAARAQLWHGVIHPALAAGTWVISDRHTLSSHTYQEMRMGYVDSVSSGDPSLTIFLNADFPVILSRAREREEACRFEEKDLMHQRRVYDRYQEEIKLIDPRQLITVDCNDFNSKEYRDAIPRILTKLLPPHVLADCVSLQAFEQQVLEQEGVRVIVKQSADLPVRPYLYEPLPRPIAPEQLTRRLKAHLNGTPFTLASTGLFT